MAHLARVSGVYRFTRHVVPRSLPPVHSSAAVSVSTSSAATACVRPLHVATAVSSLAPGVLRSAAVQPTFTHAPPTLMRVDTTNLPVRNVHLGGGSHYKESKSRFFYRTFMQSNTMWVMTVLLAGIPAAYGFNYIMNSIWEYTNKDKLFENVIPSQFPNLPPGTEDEEDDDDDDDEDDDEEAEEEEEEDEE